MDALELLVGRESALKLASPGPDQDALDKMFQSALRAPDHGRLRPWRFVVVPEDKRERFGELMADCLRRMEPDASADALQRERDKAMRAPVIVVVGGDHPARPQDPRGGATGVRRRGRREHHAGGARPGLRRDVEDRRAGL